MNASKPPVLFLSECDVDTSLLDALRYGQTHGRVHAPGNAQVANRMLANLGGCVIGLVDDDDFKKTGKQREPAYFREFTVVQEGPDVRILQHPARRHYLIKVRPACDRWLYNCAQALGIQPRACGFPSDDYGDFQRLTKQKDSHRHPAVRSLLKALRKPAGSPLRPLQQFIQTFEPAPDWAAELDV